MSAGAGNFPYGFGLSGSLGFPGPANGGAGAVKGSAFVNASGDFDPDNAGDISKTSATKQRVLLLLRTEFGSVLGQSDLGLKRQEAIDVSWEYRMRRAIENALAPAINDGTIRLEQVVIRRPLPSRASIDIIYTELASGLQETASI